jgi:PST family polysaccharide transporter
MTSTSRPVRSEVSEPKVTPSESQALSARVRKGALWVVASNLLLRIANLLLTAVVARILSPHDFGVFAVALTAYVIVASISDVGVASCLMRADLDIDSLAPTVATVSIVSGTALSAAMAVFALPIATALGSSAAVGSIRVMSIAVLLVGVFSVPNAQMTRDFKQDKVFLANALSFVASTVLLLLLAKSGGGAIAFAWSRVAGQVVMGGVLVATVPRHYRPGLSRSALSVVLRFGLPLAGANFVNYILLNVDYAFVGHLLGAARLGVYMLAFTLASAPYSLLGAVINNVSMPAFSRVKHDADLLKNAMAAGLRTVTLIALPMCAMTMVLARPLVLTLYGAKWAASATPLSILSLYGAVFIVCLLFANMLTALGRTKFLLALQIIWIGTLVPAMALGVHKDGIVGAAYAHVAVIAPIVLPSYLLALKRVTGVRILALAKAVLPALLASSAAALAAWAAAAQLGTPLAQLIVGAAAGGLTYALFAGPQVASLLGRGKIAQRILSFYGAAARLVGLPADGRAKHSARYSRGRASEALTDVGPLNSNAPTIGTRLGADTLKDLTSRANLVSGKPRIVWPTQAIAVHECSLADQERLLGPDHPHTLASRANLAYAYLQAGRLGTAVELYERMVADWKRMLGPDHPRTLRASNYLASTYCHAGRLAEATRLYEQTLAHRQRLLGHEHPSTVRSASYLASAYCQAGRLAEAIPLYEQALAGWQDRLGPDHPHTLRSSHELATAYHHAGRLAEATPLCERTLAGCIRALGDDHTLTRKVRQNLHMMHESAMSMGPDLDPSGRRKLARNRHENETADNRW